MIRLLFVCLGNICRSPAAETIMRALLKKSDLTKQVSCSSAGLTTTFLGQSANDTMRQLATERGYHISTIAKPITNIDFEQADFILGMSDEIITELQILAPEKTNFEKIHNLCDFCHFHPDTEVPDPYCGDQEEFEFVLDILEDACTGLLEMLKKKIN